MGIVDQNIINPPPGPYRGEYIYGLIEPLTDEWKYVGRTNSPYGRLAQHISTVPTGDSLYANWIRGLRKSGLIKGVRMYIFTRTEYHRGYAWEYGIMQALARSGCELVNHCFSTTMKWTQDGPQLDWASGDYKKLISNDLRTRI